MHVLYVGGDIFRFLANPPRAAYKRGEYRPFVGGSVHRLKMQVAARMGALSVPAERQGFSFGLYQDVQEKCEGKCSTISFPLSVGAEAHELGIPINDLCKDAPTGLVAPWDMCPVSCDVPFRRIDKRNAPRVLTSQHFLHLQHTYTRAPLLSGTPRSPFLLSHVLHMTPTSLVQRH